MMSWSNATQLQGTSLRSHAPSSRNSNQTRSCPTHTMPSFFFWGTIGGFLIFMCSYFFHYINENNVTYLCMTEASFSKRVAFVYLSDIQEKFLKKYNTETINSVMNYGLNSTFADTLKGRMVIISLK